MDEVLDHDGQWHATNKASIGRWRSACQNGFAARMEWTIKPYCEPNHPPVPRLAHPDRLSAKPGGRVNLSAEGSKDPDGNDLSMSGSTTRSPAAAISNSRTGAALKIERFDQVKAWFTVPAPRYLEARHPAHHPRRHGSRHSPTHPLSARDCNGCAINPH
jgi:hypothetical protein